MSDTLEEFSEAPVLTLDPFSEKAEAAEAGQKQELEEAPAWDDTMISSPARSTCMIPISCCSTARERRKRWRTFRKKPWKT